ncbi:MAG: hypothetical protein EOO36_03495 [Cytophagaceae bacterium]|nr:MAG: hypothetical protein EOO36_03495 [Cytophagaceae bacterium]
MKNSSKYLLAAVLVLLASLTAYNMALRAEYRRGDYKNPLYGYLTQNFRDFTEVAVPASSAVSVKIVPGPFSVRLHPRATEYVRLRQQGGRLVITAVFPGQRHYFGGAETVLISCPRLASLTTDAVDEEDGKPLVNKSFRSSQLVLVQGFTQDSLAVHQNRGSRVELAGNKLGHLRAVAGASPGSHGLLQLNSDNRIRAATLALGHQSELLLSNLLIPRLRYQAGDSVKVTLTGAALGSLSQ